MSIGYLFSYENMLNKSFMFLVAGGFGLALCLLLNLNLLKIGVRNIASPLGASLCFFGFELAYLAGMIPRLGIRRDIDLFFPVMVTGLQVLSFGSASRLPVILALLGGSAFVGGMLIVLK